MGTTDVMDARRYPAAGEGGRELAAGRAAPDVGTPVLVLQGAASPANHGILAVVRSLGRFGAPVFAILNRPDAAIQRSRYLRGSATADLSHVAPERLVALVDALVGGGRAPVLVPVDDVATAVVTETAALRERSLVADVPAGGLRQLVDKRAMTALADELGIPVPAGHAVRGRADLLAAAGSLGYPVVLKGADPVTLRSSVGVPSVLIVRSAAELAAVYDAMAPCARANAYLQEHIGGGEGLDWIFNGCFDRASRCVFQGTGVKVRQWPLGTGAATLGLSLPNPVVEELSRRLATAVGYAGMIDVDFRYDPRDGRYKLLDVNARIGASFRLFVADDGTDTARAHYLDLTGQPVPRARARPGRTWIVEQRDLQACARLLRAGRLGVRELVRSVARVDEMAWFDADDAAPVGAMLRYCAGRLVRAAAEPGP